MKSLTLDYTTLSNWRRCPTKFFYEQVSGLQPAQKSEALDFGALLHTGLELCYQTPDAIRVTDAAFQEMEALVTGMQPHDSCQDGLGRVYNTLALETAKTRVASLVSGSRRSLRHLLTLIYRYVENYWPDNLRPLMLEAHHKVHIAKLDGVDVYYSGRMDMLEADRVVEHKTTSFLGTAFLDRTNPNDQATGYCVLASDLLGKPIRTVLFNGLSTSGYGLAGPEKGWPLNKEPGKHFLRAETYRSDEIIEEWKDRLIADAARIIQDLGSNRYSVNAPDACTMFNTTCPYIDICRASANVRPVIKQNAFTVDRWRGFAVE